MKRNRTWLCLLLVLIVVLSGCGNQEPAGGMEMMDTGDLRFLVVTLEGTDIPQAQVRVFPVTLKEKDEFVQGEALTPVFDGVDTHFLTIDAGGAYILEVTNSQGRTVQYYLMLEDTQVCSFHICLDQKEDTGVRYLWPESPHSSVEPE